MYASNSARLEEAFNDIAESVGLCSQPGAAAEIIPLVRKWLCNEANGRWLMIVDNVDDEIMIASQKGGQSISLSSFLPQSDHGAILVTSRNADVARSFVGRQQDIITVGEMTEDEAVQLLQNKLGEAPQDHATQLVEAVDRIPLAIVQAAAYINRLGPRMSVTKYLGELQGVGKKVQLLQKTAPDIRRDGMALSSVLATWQISFEYILQKRPSAAYLLSFMSFFNQQGIPEFMMRHYADESGDAEEDLLNRQLESEDGDFDFDEDVAVLLAFSLVSTTKREDEFEMHGLVQLATRIWLGSTNIGQKCHQTFIQAMAQEFPPGGDYANWPRCQALFPHVLPIAEQEDPAIVKTNKWAFLLYNASSYAWRQGLYVQAEGMASKSLRAQREASDADESTLFYAMSLFGSILADLGKYEEAESLQRKALVGGRTVLGLEHPAVLVIMNNLAQSLRGQGKYNKAESIYRKTMAAYEKVPDLGHRDALATADNLAIVLGCQGKYEEAELIHRKTLATSEKVLGLEHPDTLTTADTLALLLRWQGKYAEAESMLRKTLVASEKVLGREHPGTLTTLNNLAQALLHQGKYGEAELMHRKTLATSEKVLGLEYPGTLTTLNNLAEALLRQAKYEEAESMFRKLLVTREKVLGLENPHTLTTADNLAGVLGRQGKYEEAESMHRKTLATSEKVLGLEHPDTLTTAGNLAGVLKLQGKYEEAESIFRHMLATREKALD